MDDKYECRYDYVLLESDLSTDSADEVKSLLEEKNDDLHTDDFTETVFNYVWLSDNETLAAWSDSGEEKTDRLNNLNPIEEDTSAKSQFDEIERPGSLTVRQIEFTKFQKNGNDETLTNVKSKCLPYGNRKENSTCSDRGFEIKEKENIKNVEKLQPKSKTSRDEVKESKCLEPYQSHHEKLADESYPGNENCNCDSKKFGSSNENTIGSISKCDSCICKETLKGLLNVIEKNVVLLKKTVDHEKIVQSAASAVPEVIDDKRRRKIPVLKDLFSCNWDRKTNQKNYFKRASDVQCKKIKCKKRLKTPEEKAARKVEISKSVDNIIISELCPSFKRCALSKEKRKELLTKSWKKKNGIFGEVSEPGKDKQMNKKNKIRKKALSFPIKTSSLSGSFWCRKNNTLFRSSNQICDERSDFRVADSENIPDCDRKTINSEQNLSELKTSDLIDLHAAKEKFSPMLRTKTNNKTFSKMNKTQKTKVMSVKGKHLEGVQKESMLIKNSWLKCMPTPTTKKLLAGKIKKEIRSLSETSVDKQATELEQFASNVDEMSTLQEENDEDAKLVKTEKNHSVSSFTGMQNISNNSSKNKMKEKDSLTEICTTMQSKEGNNVKYENKKVVYSTIELGTKTERKLGSRLCASEEKNPKNFDLGVHTENYKKRYIVGNIDFKFQPRKSSCKRKEDGIRFRRTYSKRKDKEVKVFRNVKGIRRVAFRYPCNFCGHLFSKGYVWKHEKTHVMNGYKKINQHNQQKIDTKRAFPSSKTGNLSSEAKFSDRNCLTAAPRSNLTCLTEQVHTTENRQECLVPSMLPALYEKVESKPPPKFSGSATNTQSVDIKSKSIASKTDFKVTDNFLSEVGGLLEKESEVHSACSSKAVKNNTTMSSCSIANQSCSSDICNARKKRSYLAKKAEKKKSRTYSNVKGYSTKGALMYSGKYSCTMCTYSSKYECYLTRHLSVHGGCSQTVTCKCGISFRNRMTMNQWHKRNNVHHEILDATEAQHCTSKRSARKVQRLGNKGKNMMVKSNSTYVQRTSKQCVKRRRSYRQKCGKCNYKFSNSSNWMKHNLLHENNTGSTCQECSITMKSRCSLAYWHYRHGIHHVRRKKGRLGNCTEMKQQKQEKREVFTCEASRKKQEVSVNSDPQCCAECCAAHNVVKDVEYLKVSEKLDGTTCDKCSLRLKDSCRIESSNALLVRDDMICADDSSKAPVGTNQANVARESINTSLKELTLKFETDIKGSSNSDLDIVVQTEVEKVSDVRLHSVTADLHKQDRNSQDSVNNVVKRQERSLKNENLETVGKEDIAGKILTSQNVPVYPLLRKLSLKEGEQVYNPVNGEIEVFQKDCDSKKNYRKVHVLSMDMKKCKGKNGVLKSLEQLSQIKSGEADIANSEDNNEDTRELTVLKNSESNCRKALDLSVKNKEQKNVCDSNNSNFSISFKVQIDFDKNIVSSCKVSNIQTNKCYDDKFKHLDTVLTPDEVNHTLTDSLTKTCLKIVRETLQNTNKTENVTDCNNSHIIQKNAFTSPYGYIRDSKRLYRSDSDEKQSLQYQGNDSTVKDGHKYDIYTFTDDEVDDNVYYYASKLHVTTGNEIDSSGLNEDRFEHLNTVCDKAVTSKTEAVIKAGGADENKNRDKDQDKCIDKKGDASEYSNCRSSNNSEEGNRRGRGDAQRNRDSDDKENNDRNNNNGNNTDKIQSVELLPCLVCQAVFSSKIELLRHLTKIHRLTNMCQICYFDEGEIRRFANPVSLRNHKVRDHPEDMVKCVCGAMLIDTKMLSSHLKKFKCNACESGGESSEMAKCICGKRFSSQEMLLNHRSKCRKRHCFDETCCGINDTPSVEKRRCVKTTSVEKIGKSESDGMILRPKLKQTDINNNISQPETKDISLERISKVRKCKENVSSYNEKVYEKLFETAVNLSNISRRKFVGELEQTRRYERLPSTSRLSECSLSVTDGVLDLRTKSARDRNVCSWKENVPVQPDINNNCTVQGSSSALYIDESKINNSDNLSCKLSERCPELNKLEEEKLNETARLFSGENKNSLPSQCTKEEAKPDKLWRNIPKRCGKRKKKFRGKSKVKANIAPDGKYPCKVCRRRYKKPYLYTHQKTVHARKQRALVPVTSLEKSQVKNTCNRVKYRCSWCRFVFLHWATGVRHHYMAHQKEELDLVTLTSPPHVSAE